MNYHIVLICQKILFFKKLFQLLKNVRVIFSFWVKQNQAAGQIWPTGHSFLAPVLDEGYSINLIPRGEENTEPSLKLIHERYLLWEKKKKPN